MTNIILQHFDGELRPLDRLSIDNISNYAAMIGAEYRLVMGKPFKQHLTAPCQKVSMVMPEWDDYDDVLMLDIDMFAPKNMCENVFESVGVGLYNTTQRQLHARIASTYREARFDAPYWGGAIYKMSKNTRVQMRAGLVGDDSWMNVFNIPYNYEDEGIMHILASRAGIPTKDAYLDSKWCQCSFLPNPETAGFIHIRTKVTPTGPKKSKLENYQSLVDMGIL